MKHAAFAVYLAAMTAAATPGQASIISASPTLPVLGVPYTTGAGAGCFLVPGVCVVPGSITQTSLVSSSFDASGQTIIANVSYAGTLTNLGMIPLAPISLTGTMEYDVLGRLTPTDIGSWATEIVALALTGAVLSQTLTVALDPANPSTGGASITPLGVNEGPFRIDSFFDVFVELRLDTDPPLETTRGPIRFAIGEVPEPETGMFFAGGIAALALIRRRRKTPA